MSTGHGYTPSVCIVIHCSTVAAKSVMPLAEALAATQEARPDGRNRQRGQGRLRQGCGDYMRRIAQSGRRSDEFSPQKSGLSSLLSGTTRMRVNKRLYGG